VFWEEIELDWPFLRLPAWRSSRRSPSAANPAVSGWKVGYGPRIDRYSEPWTWREGSLGLWCQTGLDIPKSSGRDQPHIQVIGDVWLSDRRPCLDRLAGRYPVERKGEDIPDRQLVAWLWEMQGPDALSALVGTFALVIWDGRLEQGWLVRDRAGAQQLYYTVDQESCWVAPRLSVLAAHRSNQVDPIALRDYLCCSFVPGNQTMWASVREVRPGQMVALSNRQTRQFSREFYSGWSAPEGSKTDAVSTQSLETEATRLRSLLDQVVQESLPDSQPVGVFLSGGLDSSAITALTCQLHQQPVHTFSIYFGADLPNELAFSSLVAEHCQTQHQQLEIPLATLWDRLPEAMALLDDPIGDPLTVPNLMVGELARQSVSVILNGEGGDPCFGGPKNQPMLLQQLYQSETSQVLEQSLLDVYLNSFQKCALDLPQLLRPDVWQSVRMAPSVFEEDLQSSADYLSRLMVLNIKFKGADQILTKVQNLTQAVAVVGRSPLFDARVVDLSLQIPPQHKLAGCEEKAVLKQAVMDILPESIVRRPKSGMMVPVQVGFRHHWNRQARRLLLSRDAAIAPYLNQDLIRQWLDYKDDPWQRYGVKLWLVASLEYWLQAHLN
jgi:asparagine synthase (glutamine-hydrolysing)